MPAELKIDPARLEDWHDATGIRTRARLGEGYGEFDIAQLDKKSLQEWLRSRGGSNPWAEDVVGIILGHDRFEKVSSLLGVNRPIKSGGMKEEVNIPELALKLAQAATGDRLRAALTSEGIYGEMAEALVQAALLGAHIPTGCILGVNGQCAAIKGCIEVELRKQMGDDHVAN